MTLPAPQILNLPAPATGVTVGLGLSGRRVVGWNVAVDGSICFSHEAPPAGCPADEYSLIATDISGAAPIAIGNPRTDSYVASLPGPHDVAYTLTVSDGKGGPLFMSDMSDAGGYSANAVRVATPQWDDTSGTSVVVSIIMDPGPSPTGG